MAKIVLEGDALKKLMDDYEYYGTYKRAAEENKLTIGVATRIIKEEKAKAAAIVKVISPEELEEGAPVIYPSDMPSREQICKFYDMGEEWEKDYGK